MIGFIKAASLAKKSEILLESSCVMFTDSQNMFSVSSSLLRKVLVKSDDTLSCLFVHEKIDNVFSVAEAASSRSVVPVPSSGLSLNVVDGGVQPSQEVVSCRLKCVDINLLQDARDIQKIGVVIEVVDRDSGSGSWV